VEPRQQLGSWVEQTRLLTLATPASALIEGVAARITTRATNVA
jgi:hypothetical protein